MPEQSESRPLYEVSFENEVERWYAIEIRPGEFAVSPPTAETREARDAFVEQLKLSLANRQ